MRGDGNGWSFGPDGSKRWGRYGAAGLLLRAPRTDGAGPVVLLQHRSIWSHQGGTWALPGGARDSHESIVAAAVREAEEETGIDGATVCVRGELVTARLGEWTYSTVVADTHEPHATSLNGESHELRWVAEADVARLRLHPGFKASWPLLRTVPARVLIGPDVDRADLELPRTAQLADGRFAWLPGLEQPHAAAPIAGVDDVPGAEITVALTGDAEFAATLPAATFVLPVR